MGDAFEFTMLDLAGTAGVLLIVGAYLALQVGVLPPGRPLYSAANALGATLILASLTADFNLPAFLIEIFWLLISLFGLWRNRAACGRRTVAGGAGS